MGCSALQYSWFFSTALYRRTELHLRTEHLAAYVAQLEEAAGAPAEETDESELPPAENLIEQLEDFLRGNRGDN